MNLPGLSRLLGDSVAGPRCRKVLYAAPDVVEAVGDFLPSGMGRYMSGAHGSVQSALAFITGIDITEAKDVPPGWFRLVHHDGCEVKDAGKARTVSHEKCTIVAEGFVDLTIRRPYAG